ncbi:MAG TPA: hypothetical protein PK082_00340 [Phycisphaerae bacterium]|nr:hypothetical protein [Phycisphaerae bacterium]
MNDRHDIEILRELARQYAEIAADPIQEERRRLWRDHNSLRPTRVPVLATYGMWNVWCREVFSDEAMSCRDPFYRSHERTLRMHLFHHEVGDDYLLEPWITVLASQQCKWGKIWGVEERHSDKVEGGAWKFLPPIAEWSDTTRLVSPRHVIDEQATARNADRLGEAIGDLLTINVDRGPACHGFQSDLSYCVTQLRGLEQLMVDMYESPRELHALMAFLRDGVLANQAAAEAAGDYSATDQENQCHPYADSTLPPEPNRYGCRRGQLWNFMAAQEFLVHGRADELEFLGGHARGIPAPVPVADPEALGADGVRLLREPHPKDRHAAEDSEPADHRRHAAGGRPPLRRADRRGLRRFLAAEPRRHGLLPVRRGPDPADSPRGPPSRPGLPRPHPSQGHRDRPGRAGPPGPLGAHRPRGNRSRGGLTGGRRGHFSVRRMAAVQSSDGGESANRRHRSRYIAAGRSSPRAASACSKRRAASRNSRRAYSATASVKSANARRTGSGASAA